MHWRKFANYVVLKCRSLVIENARKFGAGIGLFITQSDVSLAGEALQVDGERNPEHVRG